MAEKFRDASNNVNEIPRKTETLHSVMFAATGEAKKVLLASGIVWDYALCNSSFSGDNN